MDWYQITLLAGILPIFVTIFLILLWQFIKERRKTMSITTYRSDGYITKEYELE